jgi:hypothetical protein
MASLVLLWAVGEIVGNACVAGLVCLGARKGLTCGFYYHLITGSNISA